MRLLKPSWISHDGNPIFSLDIHPDGTRLATGGQGEDCGRIVIWNMAPIINDADERDENVPKMLCQMDNHLACVNCVRWSNNGKFLASGGDDKVIMIWQTSRYLSGSSVFGSSGKVNVEQWRCVNTLRGHAGDILDLAWSPHDVWLASCSVDNSLIVWNAINFPEILSTLRGHSGLVKGVSWDPVGKYLASQKFNPNILSKTSKDGNKVQHYCCCAVGSRDRSLSVWLTALKRPLVVIHDLFANSVMDISWSRKGNQLTVCSWDGTVAYVDFAPEEIGRPLTQDEHSSMHQKLYGKSLAMNNQYDSMTTIIENPDVLKLKERLKEREQIDQQQQQQQETLKCHPTAKGPINKQIETRTADGRRRITPMFIAPAPDLGDAPLPFTSKSQPTFSSSTESKSKIIIEKRDEVVCINSNSNSNVGRTNLLTPVKSNTPTVTTTSPVASTPVTIAPENIEQPEITEKVVEKPKEIKQIKVPDSTSKRKLDADDNRPAKRRPGRPPLGEKCTPIIATPIGTSTPLVAPVIEKPAREPRSGHSSLHLPALKAEKMLTYKVSTDKKETNLLLELDNAVQVSATMCVHKLKCTVGEGKSCWEVLLHSRGVAITGNSNAITVACEDNSLSIFSNLGQRLVPSVVLPSACSRLQSKDCYVMVVTSKAHVFVWDVKNEKIIVKNESLYPIMSTSSDLSLVTSTITDSGCPLITLSSGKSYIFSNNMACWMLISNTDDLIQQYSDHQSFMPSQTVFNGTVLPLASLQAQGRKSFQQASRLFRSMPAVQQASTISFLDSQLSAALNLRSSKEYKFWLLTLARYLTHEGNEIRLRELCNGLLGPLQKTVKTTWDSYILGLYKHDLLNEILLIISSNLRLQRLFTEYQEQLDLLKS
uniref:Protein HIRA n=1 Tax=Strigamia maritima TaxID=126957 RepID=T1ING8_STRMM